MTRKIRLFALPLMALPLYSIASSLEACSSSSGGGGDGPGSSQSALTCNPGETPRKLNDGDACCTQLPDGRSACRKPGQDGAGAPCTAVGTTKPGSGTIATFDVCVEESCRGDRECVDFPQLVEETTGTLTCVQKPDGKLEWELGGTASVHRVERACLVARTEVCHGPGYDKSNPDVYGYSSAYWGGYGEFCGYGAYGYSGPATINVRKLYLLSSTCTTGGTTSPCPLNGL